MKQFDIIMFVRPECPDVAMTREYLEEIGAEWTEIDIEEDQSARRQVMDWTGGRAATPTILIGETLLVVPSNEEIDAALSQAVNT